MIILIVCALCSPFMSSHYIPCTVFATIALRMMAAEVEPQIQDCRKQSFEPQTPDPESYILCADLSLYVMSSSGGSGFPIEG